jgi:hypothetical protein
MDYENFLQSVASARFYCNSKVSWKSSQKCRTSSKACRTSGSEMNFWSLRALSIKLKINYDINNCLITWCKYTDKVSTTWLHYDIMSNIEYNLFNSMSTYLTATCMLYYQTLSSDTCTTGMVNINPYCINIPSISALWQSYWPAVIIWPRKLYHLHTSAVIMEVH